AEAGIRDDLVAGVQTCALPICHFHDFGGPAADDQVDLPSRSWQAVGVSNEVLPLKVNPPSFGEGSDNLQRLEELFEANPKRGERSEERRVGKECRRSKAQTHET